MPSSALVELGYAIQSAKGTAATGAFTAIPRVSDSLSGESQTVQSQVKSSSRLDGATLQTGVSVSGEMTLEFREEEFDEFIANAFANPWDTTGATEDTLTIGKDPVYLTLAKRYPYLTDATKQNHLFTDCIVSSIGITIENQQIIGFTVGIAASDLTFPTATPWTALNDPPTKNTLVACNTVTSVKIGGVEVPSIISSMNLSWSNNTRELFDVRQCTPAEQTLDRATVSGSITAYHDGFSEDFLRDALSNKSTSVELVLQGETKTYTWLFPRVANTSSGPDTSSDDVTVEFPFSAFAESPTLTRSK